MKGIDVEKQKLDEQKKKIQIKEKILREKEQQQRARQFKEIGRIAYKANIDVLEKDVLLGAFLEISDKTQENDILESWRVRAENFLKKSEKNDESPISISFNKEASQEIKNLLKELNFKWNRFRKEYYGYGVKTEMEKKLKGTDFTIEVLN